MKNLPDLLGTNPIFALFAPSELDELMRLASIRSYQKGEKIIL